MKVCAGSTAWPFSVAGNSPSPWAKAAPARKTEATEQSNDTRMADLLMMTMRCVLRSGCYNRLTVL